MELSNLYAAQDKLDQIVQKRIGINIHDTENVDKRVFALKVEVAEFANEVGWFKYWKQSHRMDLAKTLEELADVMHFFLSVGISRKYRKFVTKLHPMQWEKVPLEHLFRYLLENKYESAGHWKNGFEHLLMIGIKLGFMTEQMEIAYYIKHKENIARQERGY